MLFLVLVSALGIWNTEASGPLDSVLKDCCLSHYESTEFFEGSYRSGDYVNGGRHEDMPATSFDDQTFDMVTSAEVFEHIPLPYKAHSEVYHRKCDKMRGARYECRTYTYIHPQVIVRE
jgi:hypothetical protein